MNDQDAVVQMLEEDFNRCRPILTAIGDEVRQSMLIAMMHNTCGEGMRVGEITACTHLSRPAISHHLKIMKDTGIIRMRKKGTMTFYHVNLDAYEPLKRLMLHLDQILCRKGQE